MSISSTSRLTHKSFTMPTLVEGYYPLYWSIRLNGEEILVGDKQEVHQYMEDILNEEGMERFTQPGYSGYVFQHHPSLAWEVCWQ